MLIPPTGFLFFLSLAAATPKIACTPYFLFPPELRVREITQLGPLPVTAGEYLLKKYATKIFESQYADKFNVCLKIFPESTISSYPAGNESLSLLRQIMVSVITHLHPDADFFQKRHPDFRIGPSFDSATPPDGKYQFGLTYTIIQYYFTDTPTQWVKGGEYSRGFIISMCLVRLTDGSIERCRLYRAPEETLLHRSGYFESERFSQVVQEFLTDPDYLVYQRRDQ